MADFAYTYGLAAISRGEVDWEDDSIRCIALMVNTTADTEKDKTFLDQFTTLGEFDGTGSYARQVVAITITVDTANDRAEITADANTTFSTLNNDGTGIIQACMIYKHVNDDTDSVPLLYIDSPAAFPFTPNGSDLVVAWDAQGVAQIKTGT